MREQIISMRAGGKSIRKISESLGISRNTVRHYIRTGSSNELAPAHSKESEPQDCWRSRLDTEALVRQYQAGVTLKQLYIDHDIPVCYSQFTRFLKSKSPPPAPKSAARLQHKAGERVQVDYCDGIPLTCRRTGKVRKSQFFCGVLPFSSKTFGEFSESQKLQDFISSHERMWAYFGGVSEYVVIDNLKSGVTKAHRYDPDVNPTYCDYSNHVGFGVLPARPYTPRDKAAVEATIRVIQQGFFQAVRQKTYYEVAELNLDFREYLESFNDAPMREYGVSRNSRFENEQALLGPLPERSFEMFEWRKAKVHPDCCIQVAKSYYSVPFNFIGQTVSVKLGRHTITVLSGSMETIASHRRVAEHQTSIEEGHYPESTVQYRSFDIEKALRQCEAIGEKTFEYAKWQFGIQRSLTALRRMQGIIRLYKNEQGFGRSAMEFAAGQALQFRCRKIKFFKNCAESFHQKSGRPEMVQVPARDHDTTHLRGDL